MLKLVCSQCLIGLLHVTLFFNHHSVADETEFASMRQMTATYEFDDGVKVVVEAFGHVNRDFGLGALILKSFKIRLGGNLVSERQLKELGGKALGIKLETIQLSRNIIGERPEEARKVYTLSFDYFADAFGGITPSRWEKRKKMRIQFNSHGVVDLTAIKE